MKTGIYFKLDQEQIEHIKAQPNQSQYIGALVKAEQHRETRREYVSGVILDWLQKDGIINSAVILADLLADSITGIDVLPEIMERAGK